MREIRMVDLHTQYLKIREEINEAIGHVLESTAFIKGPEVKAFQEELAAYMDVPHCIACGNGTDALQVAMMALDLEPGDEVITTPFTFIATIEVIRLLGLKPVLVDIDPHTFNMNPGLLEKAITPKTRAIVPIHLFGQSAHMEPIRSLARENQLYVIEDAAQALGTDYRFDNGQVKKAGTLGEIGCTSFFPSKNLGAYGDGGALFTSDEKLAEKIGALVNHGMKKRYHYDYVGVNSRLDTLQAAILRVKLQYLDAYNEARQKVAAFYDRALGDLPGLSVPAKSPFSTHIYHQYTLQVDHGKRDALKAHLQEHNIPAMIYYPVPLHVQKAYADLGYREGDFPVTEAMCKRVLSLPVHTEMEQDQLEAVAGAVKGFYK